MLVMMIIYDASTPGVDNDDYDGGGDGNSDNNLGSFVSSVSRFKLVQ